MSIFVVFTSLLSILGNTGVCLRLRLRRMRRRRDDVCVRSQETETEAEAETRRQRRFSSDNTRATKLSLSLRFRHEHSHTRRHGLAAHTRTLAHALTHTCTRKQTRMYVNAAAACEAFFKKLWSVPTALVSC